TRDGLVKILDFGLAKSVGVPGQRERTGVATEPGVVLGTAGYMSPEQVRGAVVDHRSDVFSLGAILYGVLSGDRAFWKRSDDDTTMATLKEEPSEISRPGRPIAPEIADVVSHCLEKNPDERFQSARDLAFALRVLEREGRPTSGRPDSEASRALAA